MSKAKLAVVGLGFGKNHASNIAKGDMPGELVAVADLNPDFKNFADTLNTPFYEDYKKMLEEAKPDGVIVAVPPQFHQVIAEDAMKSGAHVLIEKPITLDSASADELIAQAQELGKTILVGQHHRFDPSVQMAKERLASGELGRLIGFNIFGTLPKPEWYFEQEYRQKRATGGGTVANNGIHDIDRLRFICGDVEAVCAMKGNAFRGFEVEDSAAIAVKCENGVVGTYYISDCSHPLSEYTDTYFAENGSIRLKSSSFYFESGFQTYQEGSLFEGFDFRTRKRSETTINIPFQDNHYNEVEHFCRIILENIPPMTSGEEGKKSMELMNAMIESMDQGKVVYL